VTKNGRGLFGAHVRSAFNLQNEELVAIHVNTTATNAIAGFRPDRRSFGVEPLDDGDVNSFSTRRRPVDAEFGVTYYTGLAVVPRAGNTGHIDVAVRPK